MRINKQLTERNYKYFEFYTDYFVLKWSVKQAENFAEKIQKIIDHRGDWPSMLYQEIMSKMRFLKVKDASIALDKLEFEETVIGFADEYIKALNINTKTSQKTIEEAVTKK